MEIVSAFQSQIYRALPTPERSEAIAERLGGAVALGLLEVGDRLPSENAMAEMFGVSPTTVREALTILRGGALIETKRGRSGGTFIARRPGDDARRLSERLAAASLASLRDLGDEHTAVAVGATRLVAERAEQHELDRLALLAEGVGTARSSSDRAAADSRFHIELAAAAQSPRLTNATLRLQAEVARPLWVLADPGGEAARRELDEHRRLVTLLRGGRADDAAELMRTHVRATTARLIDAALFARRVDTPGPGGPARDEPALRVPGHRVPEDTAATIGTDHPVPHDAGSPRS